MATTDLERLVVQLSADINKFDRNLAKAQGAASKRAKAIESRFAKMNTAVASQFAAVGRAGVAALAGIGVAGVVGGFRDIAAGLAEIGSEAAQAGLSSKAFQELKFVADQNKVSVDALTDGMKELSLRADEFITTGKGSGAEAFQRLGLSASDLATKIRDPSALFTEIIGKLGQLDKAAQIRISDEIFGGTGGEQFVKLIAQGEQGIRDQIKAANDLGIVIDDQVIKRAAEVDRQFGLIASTIGSNLKAAIVDAFSALAQFIDAYREVQNQSNTTIDNRVAELGMRRLEIENKILETKNNSVLADRARTKALSGYNAELARIAAEEATLVDERSKRTTLEPIVLQNDGGTYAGGNAVASGSKDKENEFQRATAALRERVAVMQAETEAQSKINPLIEDYGFAVEKASAQQELLNAAKSAGLTITPALSTEIDKLSTAYANSVVASQRLAESQDKIRQRAEEAREFNKDLTRGLVDGFIEGKDAADLFADSLKKIGSRLLDLAFDSAFQAPGSGGFDFGSLFKGLFREKGGPVKAGQPYIVGEKRPELFVPNQSGRIVPQVPSAPSLPAIPSRSAGSASSFTYAPTIDARGADAAAVERLERAMAKDRAELPSKVIKVVRDGQKRRTV